MTEITKAEKYENILNYFKRPFQRNKFLILPRLIIGIYIVSVCFIVDIIVRYIHKKTGYRHEEHWTDRDKIFKQ